jgi:hypothetical protein
MPARTRAEAPSPPPINVVGPRDHQYLIAKQNALLPAGVQPLNFDALRNELERDPAVTVLRTVTPSSVTTFSTAPAPLQEILVASMPEARADQLNEHPQVLIEKDHLLDLSPGPAPALGLSAASFLGPSGPAQSWTIRVTGPDDTPAPDIKVYLYGSGYPAAGTTDAKGNVTLSLEHESDATLRALFVDAEREYWNLWIDQPGLVSGQVNVVRLAPLADTFPGFPEKQVFGWGQRAMRLDALPEAMNGKGTKVAVIDSGAAANTHPDLEKIKVGRDLTQDPPNDRTWTVDTVAHGSHCAGIVAGPVGAPGIHGFAPEADVHVIKIFPGGRFSSLLDALDYCIDQEIDVVNMSLGSGQSSDLLLQKINQAKQHGVACVVAAGNSGDDVQFPGTSPDVLTVAAIGKPGEYPANSFHAQQVWASDGRPPDPDGYFSAKFSCHGPEIDVCAPGVAILSSVPPDGFGAWDGTSMAAPHVTGLAALIIAHHPDFAGPFRDRNGRRVEQLFQLIKQSCVPLDLGDPNRTGAGLPNALRALRSEGPGPASEPAPVVADPSIQRLFIQLAARMQMAGLPVATPVAAPNPALLQLRDRLVAAGLLPRA